MDYWVFVLAMFLFNIVMYMLILPLSMIHEYVALPLVILLSVVDFLLIFPSISVSVRRLHDLNLTGFWLWYLSCFGIAIVFVIHLLDIDKSCNAVIEKVNKSCTNWVAWILLPFFWFFAAPVALFLLFLYKGKPEANLFGPSPDVEQ